MRERSETISYSFIAFILAYFLKIYIISLIIDYEKVNYISEDFSWMMYFFLYL